MFSVLSYLSPNDLLTASTVSRPWRDRAQDDKLWRGCFAREGWVMDLTKMRDYEELAKKRGPKAAQAMAKPGGGSELERRGSRKRKTEEAFSEGEGPALPGSSSSGSSADTNGATDTSMHGNVSNAGSGSMEGVEGASPDTFMDFDSRRPSTDSATSLRSSAAHPPTPSDLKIKPSLWRDGSLDAGEPKLSWPYLYKQRCTLEKNWEKRGQYQMFSLPHNRHQNEGHDECVYTIQHTSKHLVSGSRDRTIRKWDLNTYRLIGEPLKGHDASVLCLQFDERPEHDIIVSGGSDAYVIIWQFSTGKILKKMSRAHDESVLNLRFDDRYIVTCSKDKTIKVWNRRAILRDDPVMPSHQLPNFNNPAHHLSEYGANEMIQEYTLLATLQGHQAAVNAVMIHENTIISASGDRTIKSWNIDKGRLNKTYVGHTKGIACVQFDGRRIVSGSSDNTVRIFDAEHQAEIACLSGHGNLVRTVQARFGDLDIVTDEELEDEARRADRGFFKALEAGMQPASAARRGARNAGSSRPEDMLSVGTKVPPGGGGSRWAKIVSGSYDETVMIWKRDRDGKWAVVQPLHQDMLLKNKSHRRTPANTLAIPQNIHAIQVQQQQVGVGGAAGMNPTQQAVQAAHAAILHANYVLQPMAGMANQPLPNSQMANLTAMQTNLHNQIQGGQHQNQVGNNAAGPAAGPAPNNANNGNNQPAPPAPAAVPAGPAAAGNAANAVNHPPHHHHAHGAGQAPRAHADSNRVFKLQFDARRIICCSQNKVIVGWDFANGDSELERVGGWSVETA